MRINLDYIKINLKSIWAVTYKHCTSMCRNCISSLSCILTIRRHIHKFIKPCITCACAKAHFRFVVTLQSNIWNVHLLYLNNSHVQCTLYVNHILWQWFQWHPSERQRQMKLEIVQSNCWVTHNWNKLGTVSIEKWFEEIGVTCRLESFQRESFAKSWAPKVMSSGLMFKEDSSKPSRSCVWWA